MSMDIYMLLGRCFHVELIATFLSVALFVRIASVAYLLCG